MAKLADSHHALRASVGSPMRPCSVKENLPFRVVLGKLTHCVNEPEISSSTDSALLLSLSFQVLLTLPLTSHAWSLTETSCAATTGGAGGWAMTFCTLSNAKWARSKAGAVRVSDDAVRFAATAWPLLVPTPDTRSIISTTLATTAVALPDVMAMGGFGWSSLSPQPIRATIMPSPAQRPITPSVFFRYPLVFPPRRMQLVL